MKKELILVGLLFLLLMVCFIKYKNKENFAINNKAIIPLRMYPELDILEINKDIIITELNNIINKKVWVKYDFLHKEKIISKNYNKDEINNLFKTIDKYYLNSLENPDWFVFGLIYLGSINDFSKEYFPKTIELLEKINYVMSAGISVLEGGGYIPPHSDEGIERYKYHLPLIIPENCGIKINNIDYDFNEPFIFDDTYIHSVWNNSNKNRFVLIVDIIRK